MVCSGGALYMIIRSKQVVEKLLFIIHKGSNNLIK